MTNHTTSNPVSCVPSPILHSRFREFDVYAKDDGTDYLGLFRDHLDGAPPVRTFVCPNHTNRASLVELGGRKFVLKKDGVPLTGLERKVWRALKGPFYSTLMPRINRAVSGGCGVAVDIFLVAEKMRGRYAEESYILMEYAEGVSFADIPDFGPYRGLICDAFIELHRYGLSLGDPNPANLVLTGSGGIKMFDFSVRGFQITGRAKDRIKCRKVYGVEIPSGGWIERAADAVMLLQLRKTAYFRKLRGKPYIEY